MLSPAAKRAEKLFQQKRLGEAANAFIEVLSREKPSGAVHRLYGLTLREAGHPAEAVVQLKTAVVLDRDIESMLALAETLRMAGECDDSQMCLEALLAREPDHAPAWRALAEVAMDRKDDHKAAALLREALERAPDDCTTLTLFGVVGLRLGFWEAARAALLKARDQMPCDHEAMCKVADGLCQAELEELGLEIYQAALQLKPDFLPALGNQGAAFLALGRPHEALHSLEQADKIAPNTIPIVQLLMTTWRNLGDLDRAEAFCRQAMRLQPGSRTPRANWATLLLDRGHFAAALAAVQALSAELPDDAEMERFEGLLLLLTGDFAPGWQKLEARLRMGEAVKLAAAVAPRWRGESLSGQRVLISAEEGFGDSIHLIRFARRFVAQGAVVGVRAPSALRRLLQRADGISAVHGDRERPAGYAFDMPMLSLPGAFGTDLATIPCETPYLSVDAADLERWRERLGPQTGKLRVGLVWAGNPRHRNDCNRSLAWAALRDLTGMDGVAFYSLQVGRAQNDLLADPHDVIDLAPDLTDYYDTACAVSALDLVIAVDTSTAHLTGALHVPVWLLLPHAPDWRWLLDREESPWYPTMRLFRQTADRTWPNVIARVSAALLERVARQSA